MWGSLTSPQHKEPKLGSAQTDSRRSKRPPCKLSGRKILPLTHAHTELESELRPTTTVGIVRSPRNTEGSNDPSRPTSTWGSLARSPHEQHTGASKKPQNPNRNPRVQSNPSIQNLIKSQQNRTSNPNRTHTRTRKSPENSSHAHTQKP